MTAWLQGLVVTTKNDNLKISTFMVITTMSCILDFLCLGVAIQALGTKLYQYYNQCKVIIIILLLLRYNIIALGLIVPRLTLNPP